MTRRLSTKPVPENRAEAERYILREMAVIGERLDALEAERNTLLSRRRELYLTGRDLGIQSGRMAKAAGVTDAALVLSSQKRKLERSQASSDGA